MEVPAIENRAQVSSIRRISLTCVPKPFRPPGSSVEIQSTRHWHRIRSSRGACAQGSTLKAQLVQQ